MKVELREHTARKGDEFGRPLIVDGKTVSALPDERSIWASEDGEQWYMVGYVGSPPGHPAMFILHAAGADEEIVALTNAAIEAEFGCLPRVVTNVPKPAEAEPDVAEYDDYGIEE